MKTKENPAPRWRAGSRADFKAHVKQSKASAPDWEAEATATWIVAHLPMVEPLARILAALASLRGAVA